MTFFNLYRKLYFVFNFLQTTLLLLIELLFVIYLTDWPTFGKMAKSEAEKLGGINFFILSLLVFQRWNYFSHFRKACFFFATPLLLLYSLHQRTMGMTLCISAPIKTNFPFINPTPSSLLDLGLAQFGVFISNYQLGLIMQCVSLLLYVKCVNRWS